MPVVLVILRKIKVVDLATTLLCLEVMVILYLRELLLHARVERQKITFVLVPIDVNLRQ
jgi:hypothetical protein